MTAPILSIAGLSHTYGHGPSAHHAIAQIDCELEAGQTLSIVGPSGAGKTTLLRCLAGLQRPTSGRIEVGGKPVTRVPESIAVVFQDYSRSLMPWLSVLRNVEFPLRGRLSRPVMRQRAMDALALVGLRDAAHKRPRQLSGGMQQRVAIARAVVVQPRLLIMDEPFASVDAQTRAELEDLTLDIRTRTDTSMVVVTHDIDESVYLADTVLVLSGAPARVIAQLPVNLGYPRDQISTKRQEQYLDVRSKVYEMIRSARNR
jgi:NitT/TauT family transport system ATP-binding protein